MKKDIFNFKFWQLYIAIAMVYLLINYILNEYIFVDSYFINSLSEKLDLDRIIEFIAFQRKFQFLGYIMIPLFLLIKIWILSGILFTGLYFFQKRVLFTNCLKIIILSELVYIFSALTKIVWIMISPDDMQEFQKFSPLSISQLLNLDKIPNYLLYPFQLINIFEIAYWLLLAYGIMIFTKQDWSRSLKTVASSYGVALFIWVVFIVFMQVQFT